MLSTLPITGMPTDSITKQITEAACAYGMVHKQPTHIYMTPRALLDLLDEHLRLSSPKTICGMEILVVDELPSNVAPDAKFIVSA